MCRATLAAFTLILLCIILYLRKSINKAVAIIQEAAKAVRSMPMLMTFPVHMHAANPTRCGTDATMWTCDWAPFPSLPAHSSVRCCC